MFKPEEKRGTSEGWGARQHPLGLTPHPFAGRWAPDPATSRTHTRPARARPAPAATVHPIAMGFYLSPARLRRNSRAEDAAAVPASPFSSHPATADDVSPAEKREKETPDEERMWLVCEQLDSIDSSERLLAAKHRSLQSQLKDQFHGIQKLEKELRTVQMERQLATRPKKLALEHLRKKIEAQSEKVLAAKQARGEVRKILDEAEDNLSREEQAREVLCAELKGLVAESFDAQFSKLEELQGRLKEMDGSFTVPKSPTKENSAAPLPPSTGARYESPGAEKVRRTPRKAAPSPLRVRQTNASTLSPGKPFVKRLL